jgi:hypothetical protein
LADEGPWAYGDPQSAKGFDHCSHIKRALIIRDDLIDGAGFAHQGDLAGARDKGPVMFRSRSSLF